MVSSISSYTNNSILPEDKYNNSGCGININIFFAGRLLSA